ncbi:TonB-dependent receptor [Roseateles koreensis]|uniref:TonB-dependent receptor n=1 Tax=Roseateles koreensis TaxID=2987526 RepID=A0ABT5KV63_9BURK|nr:TonB-dependent receptor [Roseateles koreensis]MDC8786814.1 TonB-dependent receptor [Roseateles koreensis]
MNITSFPAWALSAVAASLLASGAAQACSSCGCLLNSDWASQGFKADAGLTLDLRHDYFDQDQLRSGTGTMNRSSLTFPNEQEIQQRTTNHVTTLTADYGINADWGVSLQLPYISRSHTTIAAGDTDLSSSRSSSFGDARVLGRYRGFNAERSWGLLFGLKLPTGAIDVNFNGGPQADQPLDRGLQAGTGSTDLLVGAYHFGSIGAGLDYFGQVLVQAPLSTKDQFKPGVTTTLTAGLRYVSESGIVPQLQLNLRHEGRESGDNADAPNSGSTLVYLSPGATVALTEQLQGYGFVQVPIYQHVTGLQLEPKVTFSLGLRYGF